MRTLGAITTPQAAQYFMALQQRVVAITDAYNAMLAVWTAWEQEAAAAGLSQSKILELKMPWDSWVALANKTAGIFIANEMVRIQGGGAPGNIANYDLPPAPTPPPVNGSSSGGGLSGKTLAIAAGVGALLLVMSLRD